MESSVDAVQEMAQASGNAELWVRVGRLLGAVSERSRERHAKTVVDLALSFRELDAVPVSLSRLATRQKEAA